MKQTDAIEWEVSSHIFFSLEAILKLGKLALPFFIRSFVRDIEISELFLELDNIRAPFEHDLVQGSRRVGYLSLTVII